MDYFIDIPVDVWVETKHDVTFKKGMVAPSCEPSLLIYDEGCDCLAMITVYQAIVK